MKSRRLWDEYKRKVAATNRPIGIEPSGTGSDIRRALIEYFLTGLPSGVKARYHFDLVEERDALAHIIGTPALAHIIGTPRLNNRQRRSSRSCRIRRINIWLNDDIVKIGTATFFEDTHTTIRLADPKFFDTVPREIIRWHDLSVNMR